MPTDPSGRRRPPKPKSKPQGPVVAAPVLGVGGDGTTLGAEQPKSNSGVAFDANAFAKRVAKMREVLIRVSEHHLRTRINLPEDAYRTAIDEWLAVQTMTLEQLPPIDDDA